MSVPDIQHALDLLRQQEIDAAISALEKKVDEIPAHLTAHALLARAYETRGDWSQALRSWENAHFLMPNSPTIRDGKQRVLARIDELDTRAPDQHSSDQHSADQRSADQDAASTTSSASSPRAASEPSPTTDDPASSDPAGASTSAEDTAEPVEAEEPVEAKEPADTSGSAASDVARRAQALLSDTPAPPAASSSGTSSDATPSAGEDATSPTPDSDEPDVEDRSGRDTGDPSSDTAAHNPESDPVEIRTSRRPGTTSFRPDTAIIDAASSLLSQKPTPSADDPASSASHEKAETDPADSPPQKETETPSDLEALRRSAEEEARRGGARPDMTAPAGSESDGAPDDTVGDLDQLIQDLESARIQPSPDLDDLPTPDLDDDVEDLVSETLARIYGAQSQYREAARIYVKLASQEPANARKFLEQAAEMREKAEAKEAEERAAEARSSSEH